MAPPPSVSCLHFGFWIQRLVPTLKSIGLRFVFPSECLHRHHYDSMVGPALEYPRVTHGPGTYEPHAHGRTLSSAFSPLVLVSLLSSILVLSAALHLPWYLFSLRFGFLHFPSALVLLSSAFLSVNVSSAGLVLVPLSATPASIRGVGESIASFRCFGYPHLRHPFFGLLGLHYVIIRRPPCGLHIRLSRGG